MMFLDWLVNAPSVDHHLAEARWILPVEWGIWRPRFCDFQAASPSYLSDWRPVGVLIPVFLAREAGIG